LLHQSERPALYLYNSHQQWQLVNPKLDSTKLPNTMLSEHKHGVIPHPGNAELLSISEIAASLYQQMLPITDKAP